MKKIILSIAILFSLSASAQNQDSLQRVADSIQMSHQNEVITVTLPVKAVVLYAYYFQRNFDWSNRLAPDGYKGLVGTGTKPDSLVTVTVPAKNLSDFVDNVNGERYGAIFTYAQSVFNNTPAIAGYTALFTQVVNISNGNTSQKAAANYMIWRYNKYTGNLTNLINDYYTKGLYWIQH
jgi:hypothetical protein